MALVFLGLWRGGHPQWLPSYLQGHPLHRSIDAACILEKCGMKGMHIFIKVGEIKGRKIKLLKHVFALHSLLIIFSKKFFARYNRSIAFYPPLRNASIQCVLPTPFRPIFYIFVLLSLTDSFQNSPKTRIKLHKIAHKMSDFFRG